MNTLIRIAVRVRVIVRVRHVGTRFVVKPEGGQQCVFDKISGGP